MTGAPSHDIIDSPIGPLTLVEREGALCGLYMDGHRRWVPDQSAMGGRRPDALRPVAEQLEEYFAGGRTAFDLPLGATGSAFQREVWDLLCTIPYGETTTYGEMAERLGRPGAARAVGSANGTNPISIIVPCHRVIGAGGKLTGYGGGLERKRALLDLEQTRDNPRLW